MRSSTIRVRSSKVDVEKMPPSRASIRRLRSSQAFCSASVVFLFLSIVLYHLPSNRPHVASKVAGHRENQREIAFLHPPRMPPPQRPGKTLFQPRLRQTKIASSCPAHGVPSNQP